MAEKTVTVRLKAVIDQYQKAMKLAGDTTATTAQKGEAFHRLGRNTSDFGNQLSRNVTLPILAAGAVMTKMAGDFDSVFVQMQATAGVAASEVAGLKDEVLALATETGRAPQELAEGLLLIRSSGFAGAQAMQVLEMAARGASIGMGTTAELANALTNVIAGYGRENITAAAAMDILTAAVQEGKAEAAQMAPQFGRLVPIAAELGVGFEDVAGSLAYLTRATGDASQSSTALQGILSKLLKPSEQGEQALREIGESAGSLRDMLGERKLLGTLSHLRKEMGQQQFGLLFDDVQALNGALQMTGPGLTDAEAVIAAVTDSVGKADVAFEKWSESIGAKNAKAWATAQAALISFGDVMAGPVADVFEFLGKIVGILADMPEGARQIVVAFAGVAAATGPLVRGVGGVVNAYGSLFGAMSKVGSVAGFSGALSGSIAGFALLAPAVVGAQLALQDYLDTKAEAKRITEDLTEALESEAAGLEGIADQALVAELTAGDLGTALRNSGADLDIFTTAVKESGDELERLEDLSVFDLEEEVRKLADSGSALGIELQRLMDDSDFDQFGTLVDTLDGLADRYDEATTAAEDNAYATEQVANEQGQTTQQTELLNQALQDTIDTMRSAVDPFFAMQDAIAGVRDAQAGWEESQRRVTEAQVALDEAVAAHGPNSDQAAEAARRLTEAENGVTDAQWNAASASVNLVAAGEELRRKMAEQGLSADTARQRIYDWAIQAGFAEDEARIMAGGIDSVTAALDRVPGVTETKLVVKTVYETTQHGARSGPGFKLHEGGYVPGPRGREIAGLLLGGEEVLHWDDPRHSSNLARTYEQQYMAPSGSMTHGGSSTVVHNYAISLEGAIIASERDALRWLNQATAKAQRVRA